MTKGVLLFASNNQCMNYVKQANFLAKRIKKYMDLPVTLVTDVKVKEKYPEYVENFDNIVFAMLKQNSSSRRHYDGDLHNQVLPFHNKHRASAYDLTPYDQTIIMDTDYIISNDILNNCFTQHKDLMLYKDATHLGIHDKTPEFQHISDTSVDFYWATVCFFRKTKETKIFFDLVKHIEENYWHYRNVYQFTSSVFRNDFAFSIAAHIMNGYQAGNFVGKLPGKKYYTIGKDVALDIKDDEIKVLVQKTNRFGEYTGVRMKGSNVHIMNKFSLERIIDNE